MSEFKKLQNTTSHLSFSVSHPTLHLSVSPGLMYEEEGALIELMICAIKQAAEVMPPVGRTQSKKVVTDKYAIILRSVYVFIFCEKNKHFWNLFQSRNKFHISVSQCRQLQLLINHLCGIRSWIWRTKKSRNNTGDASLHTSFPYFLSCWPRYATTVNIHYHTNN